MRLLTGIRAERLIAQAGETELDAVGLNCGVGSGHMLRIVENLRLPRAHPRPPPKTDRQARGTPPQHPPHPHLQKPP